jgi:hypothetical protein
MRLRFGECVFDGAAREVTRGGAAVPLTPKAFQLLSVLLDRRPGAVARGELHDLLWPGTFVSHTSLPGWSRNPPGPGDDSRRRPSHRSRLRVRLRRCGRGREFRPGGRLGCALMWSDGCCYRRVRASSGAARVRLVVPSTRVSRCHARIVVEGGRRAPRPGQQERDVRAGRRVDGPRSSGDEIVVGPAVSCCDPRAEVDGHRPRLRRGQIEAIADSQQEALASSPGSRALGRRGAADIPVGGIGPGAETCADAVANALNTVESRSRDAVASLPFLRYTPAPTEAPGLRAWRA